MEGEVSRFLKGGSPGNGRNADHIELGLKARQLRPRLRHTCERIFRAPQGPSPRTSSSVDTRSHIPICFVILPSALRLIFGIAKCKTCSRQLMWLWMTPRILPYSLLYGSPRLDLDRCSAQPIRHP